MNFIEISKFMSLILRHKPDVIGIELDSHGWAVVESLIVGIQKNYPEFDMNVLRVIVDTDNKQRYIFNEDKTKIRANQGHSIKVDLDLVPKTPPKILYHGTGEKYVLSIDSEGLKGKSRQYVHLSVDPATAKAVGTRHGSPVIYEIRSGKMHDDGYTFYKSKNGIWLTDNVPPNYLRRCGTHPDTPRIY